MDLLRTLGLSAHPPKNVQQSRPKILQLNVFNRRSEIALTQMLPI